MRWIGLIALLISTAVLAGPITADSSVDEVLDALDARGKDLKTLSADVKMADVDPNLGDVATIRTGHLYYQDLGHDDARFRATFDKKITGKLIEDAKHDWLYADGKLTDRDYHLRQQTTRQVLKPGEKMQLFKLQGPFPLPLGQDKADVHKSFDVKKIPLKKDEPAGTVHLELSPVKGSDLARKFKKIDVWVDPKTSMPVRIDTLDANETTLNQTELSNVKVNEPLMDNDFQIDTNVDGWNVKDEKFQ